MTQEMLADRYELLSEIGRGAMGVVYRAHDRVLSRDVALKRIAGGTIDADARDRWMNEARASARLNHPGIASIFDAGESAGRPYIVMELVPGRSLREAGPRSVEEVVALARQMGAALEHAHAQGIVHRDLKPENILLTGDVPVQAKIVDFGVAFLGGAARLTTDGGIVGTALYLAPEQAVGETVDGRADLYSLGVVLYELLAGRPPFTGDDPLKVVSEHLFAPVVPPSTHNAAIPPGLDALVLKLLAKRPEDRFPGAAEMAQALDELVLGVPAAPGAEEMASVAMLAQLARGRLTGRTTELGELRNIWNRAIRGEGQLALVSGEPGVGKTRLAAEAMVYARLHGALVLKGGCYEFEATTPYLPFVEALQGWVRTRTADQLQAEVGALAPELKRFAPELESLIGPIPPSPSLPPNEERLRLFDSVARFLRQQAARSGLLLFLDDLHWADQGTLSLLHHLLRHLQGDRVLLLGAYREVELDRAHPLAAALVEWNRERLAVRIPLGRLSLDETAQLLATLFGEETISREFAAAMYHETEGNPFFVEEVVKSLIDQGQIYREERRWQRRSIGELAIPQSVKEAIGRRLDRLGRETVDILHTAAALGKVFDFRELAAASPAAEERLLDALDEATAAQLLRPDTGERFAFTHDKIREVLYEEQNPIRRRRLHQRIGEGLETLHTREIEAHAPDLAYHFLQSGELEKGFDYCLMAGRKAEAVYAFDEALRYIGQARECAEALKSDDRLARAHEAAGAIHNRSGAHARAAEEFEKALQVAADPAHRAELKARIGIACAQYGEERGLKFLEEAAAELDHERQHGTLVATMTSIGRFDHYHLEHAKAIEALMKALKVAEERDDPGTIYPIYAFLSGANQNRGLFDESNRWAERSIELGRKRGIPDAEAVGHEFLAENLPSLGRWRESLEHAAEDRRIGQAVGARDRIAWSHFAGGLAWFAAGRPREMLAELEAGQALAEEIGESRLATVAGSLRCHPLAELGRIDEALEEGRRSVEVADRLGQPWARVFCRRSAATAHLLAGDPAAAERVFREGFQILAGSDNMVQRMLGSPSYATALVALGRPEEALELCAPLIAFCRAGGIRYYAVMILAAMAQALAALDRRDEAAAAIDEALRLAEEIDSRVELGRALCVRGGVHATAGRAAEARADLDRACQLLAGVEAVIALAAAQQARAAL